ncbi:MAG: hypothetical protein NTY90_05360 [Candidatus Micrarchaeota archaeon]|nr:hypothetical protein [Candidatus Micrarchaeota archaeon]
MKTEEFVAMFIMFLLVLWYATGVAPQDSVFVKGAAAFITIPLDVLGPLTGEGLLFMALLFLILVKYLPMLDGFFGEPVYAFIIVAAVILLVTGQWVP